MAESVVPGLRELAQYDYIQFVAPDLNGIPRGKVMKGKFAERAAREGFEMSTGTCMPGNDFEYAPGILDVIGKNGPNEMARPCLDTLTPLPWLQHNGRRVGNVLCDLCTHDGEPDLTSPRQQVKAQLDALHEKHGLMFKSAFEYEFFIFKDGIQEPLGGEHIACFDVRLWGQHQQVFCDLYDTLEEVGVKISTLMHENAPGQWEITTDPVEGIRGGDVGFHVKNVVKGLLQARGYNATFMTKPMVEHSGSGMHLNHSLWTLNGDSAMLDEADPDKMSKTARHWLAGLMTHAPALTALCCPTVNCYRRIFTPFAPGKINWGLDDRYALIRVRTASDNVFMENRLPSGSCNPYLAIASTLAAGIDGLDRQLQCPAPGVVSGELPKTLARALDALEKDEQLRSLMGSRFVDGFVITKTGCEVKRFENAGLGTEEEKQEFERKLYLKDY